MAWHQWKAVSDSYIYMFMWVHVYVHIHVTFCVSPWVFPTACLAQGSLIGLELHQVGWAKCSASIQGACLPLLFTLPSLGWQTWPFLGWPWASDSGLQACGASTLTTQPFSQALLLFFWGWQSNRKYRIKPLNVFLKYFPLAFMN